MIKFAASIKKMWPGCIEEKSLERLNKSLDLVKVDFIELNPKQGETFVENSNFHHVFKYRYGILRGAFAEISFVEKCLRDQLPSVTKLGNIWYAIKFLLILSFLVSIVTFSGGVNNQIRIIDVMESLGIWTITEIAFAKSVLASSRFTKMISRLGISLRSIVVACFYSTWIELSILFSFGNIIMFFTQERFFKFSEYVGVLFGILCLFLIFAPIAYFVSRFSSTWTDARFAIGPIFRIFVLTTPVFSPFHQEYGFISNAVSILPTNISFIGIIENLDITKTNISMFFVGILVSSSLWFLKYEKVKYSSWIEKKHEI